jgi:hypothetical protein
LNDDLSKPLPIHSKARVSLNLKAVVAVIFVLPRRPCDIDSHGIIAGQFGHQLYLSLAVWRIDPH